MTWRGYEDALRAQTEVLREVSGVMGQRVMEGWLLDRMEKHGREAAAPAGMAFTHAVEDVANAPAIWVSPEMYDLTLDGAMSFDIREDFAVEDMFLPSGFVVLPEAFRSIDTGEKEIAFRAMSWALADPGIVVKWETDDQLAWSYDLNEDGIRTEPAVRFIHWSHIGDPDGHEHPGNLFEGAGPWSILHATTIPRSLMRPRGALAGNDVEGAPNWVAWWRVLNRVMGQRITSAKYERPGRSFRRDAQRAGVEDPSLVLVVELRRAHKTREADEELEPGNGRVYTHRWITGSHWRNHWYPSLGIHRQILIPAHVKGPEGAPLIHKRRVFKFDR